MKKIKKVRTIPTIIGLLVLTVGLITSVFLVNQSQNLVSRASGDTTPSQIRITNQTATSASVSWFTTDLTKGEIKYGSSHQLDQTALDQRDSVQAQAEYSSHYVNLDSLTPDTTYYFEIWSNGKKYDDNGKPFEIVTGPQIAESSQNQIIYGQVFQTENLPAQGAVVYLSLPESNALSALVDSSGSWAVSLHLARTRNLTSSANYLNQVAEIFVQSPLGTANAITNTSQPNPVPDIVLGESYDFQQAVVLQPETEPTSGFETDKLDIQPEYKLTVMNPGQDEPLSTQQPLFFGKAPANQTLTIEVHSSQLINGTVITNEWGDWSWSPPEDLEPGEHTLTVSFYNEDNLLETITRSFVVLAAEDSQLPAFTATPSATTPTPTTGETPAPLPSPTETPEPSPSPSPTATPTTTPTPLPTTTPSPTVTTTPTPTTIPTTSLTPTATPSSIATDEVAAPGTIAPTYLILLLGALLIGGGVAIAIL